MLGLITSLLYNGACSIFFTLFLLVISYQLCMKIWTLVFDRELNKSGCYILITGCDTGFGHSAAYELNQRGTHVFATCLLQESVDKFERDDNFKGTAFKMDVTKMEDIEKGKEMIGDIVKDKGLWCVVNNAGIGEHAPIEWLSESDMKRVADVNLWGAINVTKVMLPLVKQCEGRLVNISSVMGRVPFAHFASYCMSKHALEAFSDCLRYEITPWRVSVHVIEPGACPTTNFYDGFQERWPQLWDIQPQAIREEYGPDFHKTVIEHLKHFMVKVKSKCNPRPVVDAYVHAALSSRPRRRYLVGLDAKVFTAVSMLPTVLGDFINWMLHLHKPVMPAACKSRP